jgi:hypothetical protein
MPPGADTFVDTGRLPRNKYRSFASCLAQASCTLPSPYPKTAHPRFADYTSFWLVNGRGYSGFTPGAPRVHGRVPP